MKEPKITPELQAEMARAAAELDRENSAGKAAAANPLPGPLADAFSPNPDIPVGRWTVRRFVDRDFELLKALGHPLFGMTLAGMKKSEIAVVSKGKAAAQLPESDPRFDEVWNGIFVEMVREAELDKGEEFDGRGPAAWELAWLLTRPVRQAKEAFRSGGAGKVKELAEDEFGECSFAEILKLSEACFAQYQAYRSPMLEYGAKEQEGGEGKPERPFPSTGTPTTGSAG